MAKMYRRKRVSKGYNIRTAGTTQWMSNYEVGHALYQARHDLPLDAPLHMEQGYTKAAKEEDIVMVTDFRRLYRLGLIMPLPMYRYMVDGIKPFIFDKGKAVHPSKRGQGNRLPLIHRIQAARVRNRAAVKRAFG